MIADIFTRLRHRNGYGIHSPLVYALSREVFARHSRDAAELEAVKGFLARRGLDMGLAYDLPETMPLRGALCIMRRTGAVAGALTIDRKRYTLIICDGGLPVQHFIL